MNRLIYIAILLGLGTSASAVSAQELLLQLYPPPPGRPLPTLALDFANNVGINAGTVGTAASMVAVTRALGNATDLLPSSKAGATFQTFAANTARITPGLGLLIEGSRTNLLLNSTAPVASQGVTVVNGSTYTLWTNGGTATVSVCAAGSATNGAPFTFAASGTACTVTSTSSNAYQLELGGFASSLIVTAGATATRAFDNTTVPSSPAVGGSYSAFVFVYFISPTVTTVNQAVYQLDDGTNTNDTRILKVAAGQSNLLNSGGVAAQTTTLLLNQNTYAKHAIAVSTNYQVSTQDGANPAVSFGAFTPFGSFTTFRLGGNATGNAQPCFCYIAKIKEWPTIALTPAQLQQITKESELL